ncbi:RTP3 protein, partial [Polypterus senegalus]
MDMFDELLDTELDNDDPWTFNFNYGMDPNLTEPEKRRGWKTYRRDVQAERAICLRVWGAFRLNPKETRVMDPRLKADDSPYRVTETPGSRLMLEPLSGHQLPGLMDGRDAPGSMRKAVFKFTCSNCSKWWPSGRSLILFRYRRRTNGSGTVILRPLKQACRKCQGPYELPGFCKEKVKKCLLALISHIKKNCYGYKSSNSNMDDSVKPVWTKPHEVSFCEACRLGICRQDRE